MTKKTCFFILLFFFFIYEISNAQNPVLNFKLNLKTGLFKTSGLYSSLKKDKDIKKINELEYISKFLNNSIAQITCNDSISFLKFKNSLENNPDIEWVEENKKLKIFQTDLPNDSLLNRQWHWFTVGADYLFTNNYFEDNENKIPIAVIDTGVDYEHPDLKDQFWVNPLEDINGNNCLDEEDINGIDEDGNGIIDDIIGYDFTDAPDFPAAGDYLDEDPFPMDDYGFSGHGTPVAGLIAAQTNNVIGIAGISPNSKIMALRAGSASGYLEVDDVVKAIFYAVDNGAKIINMSFGDTYPSQLLHQAIRYAFEHNVVMVAAAGNSGNSIPNYPAAWPEVLGIASVNSNNFRSGFSNYGSWISFSLPGESVFSTATDNTYTSVNGTSFACPIAAAVISVPLSQALADGNVNITSFYSQLESHSIHLGDDSFNEDYGYGMLKLPSSLLESTLEISFQSPQIYETIAGDALPLVTTVWGENIKSFSFKINLGKNELWHSTTYSKFIYNDTITTINTSTFPEDTLLILVAEIITFDNKILQKVSPFKISNSIPILEELTLLNWWDGPNEGDFLKIKSNVNCNASLKTYNTENELQFTHVSEGTGTEHFFTLNEAGNYSVKFQLNNNAGSSGIVPDSIISLAAKSTILPEIPYNNIAMFPYAGYTIDTLTDFNQNGFPEIIFSKSGADTVFGRLNAAEIFETNDSLKFNILATTSKPFIPRSFGDVNGDGKPEIFAGYGAKAYLLSDMNNDNIPFETAWQDTINNWAACFKDFDEDGIYEGIVRKNNEYQIWKWDFNFQPSAIYSFELPVDETPIFSVPNIIFADLEGDGNEEAIFGDFNGNLYIFKNEGVFSFSFFQKIQTGYQGISDHIIAHDQNQDGADEIYFIHSIVPNTQSDHLMNYSYWQLNKLALTESELTLYNLFNFKGVQLSNHFFNGLQKIENYLVVNLSPHQYWINLENEIQPTFLNDNSNINKSFIGNFAGNSILVGSSNEKLAVKKIVNYNQNNFLSYTDFYQTNDTLIHIEWQCKLLNADTVQIIIKKDSVMYFENHFTGNNEIDLEIISGKNNYECKFHHIKDGKINQTITKNIISHYKPDISMAQITASPFLLKINSSESIDNKNLTLNNFILKENKLKPSQINILNNNKTILLLFENLSIHLDSLKCLNIRDQKGYFFDFKFFVDFSTEHNEPFYPEYAILNSREQIVLEFNNEIQDYNLSDSSNFRLKPFTEILNIQKNTQIPNQVNITISKNNNLGGYGSRGTISIKNIKNIDNTIMANGNTITLPLMNKVESLNKSLIFPNPYNNKSHDNVIIGNIPYGTQIKILSINGELLYQTEETSGSGSLKINIKKELPELVSNVYIMALSHKGKSKIKKWFYIK